jgi:hypothetical protein
LATAVVEEEVTLEKLAEALGAGQLPYIDQLLAAQAGAEVR